MMPYLTAPGFAFFDAGDVMDYGGLGQIWVKFRVSSGCLVRAVYNYATGRNSIEVVEDQDPATPEFYAELETIAMFWGQTVADSIVE